MKLLPEIALCVIILLCLFGCKQDPLSRLPQFSFRLYDSITLINSKSFPEGRPIVLFHFESDCRECQQTTDSLLQNMQRLKNVQFYLLSVENFANVNLFRNYYHLDRYKNLTVGQDYDQFMRKHFKSYSIPFIALYNSDKKLVGMYKGKPVIKELVHAITLLN